MSYERTVPPPDQLASSFVSEMRKALARELSEHSGNHPEFTEEDIPLEAAAEYSRAYLLGPKPSATTLLRSMMEQADATHQPKKKKFLEFHVDHVLTCIPDCITEWVKPLHKFHVKEVVRAMLTEQFEALGPPLEVDAMRHPEKKREK